MALLSIPSREFNCNSPALPSLSSLTGTVRPETASETFNASLRAMDRTMLNPWRPSTAYTEAHTPKHATPAHEPLCTSQAAASSSLSTAERDRMKAQIMQHLGKLTDTLKRHNQVLASKAAQLQQQEQQQQLWSLPVLPATPKLPSVKSSTGQLTTQWPGAAIPPRTPGTPAGQHRAMQQLMAAHAAQQGPRPPPTAWQRPDYSSPRNNRLHTPSGRLATPGSTTQRARPATRSGPCADFIPSRGQMYAVFTAMDRYRNGKVTRSQFEDAAIGVGMKSEQIDAFFNRLDEKGIGYITIKEWGKRDSESSIQSFSRLYLLGQNGKVKPPQQQQEIKSLEMAVRMAMFKMALSGERHMQQQKVSDAFHFIDSDGSGQVSKSEVADALTGLGIICSEHVVDEVMELLDKDGSGTIDYSEFVQTLFPTWSKAYH